MDDLSTLTYIAGNESDLILISGVLPKRCVNSLSTAGLHSVGISHFIILTPTLTRSHKTCAVLGFMSPTNYKFLKSPLIDALTINMFGFQ